MFAFVFLPNQVLSPFTVDHAIYARDALAKAIYGRTFTWLVGKINEAMENKVRKDRKEEVVFGHILVLCHMTHLQILCLQDPSRKTVIGLLDIYGFEVFYVNRWVPHAL